MCEIPEGVVLCGDPWAAGVAVSIDGGDAFCDSDEDSSAGEVGDACCRFGEAFLLNSSMSALPAAADAC